MNETINSVFTETQDGVNASINQLEVTCITSKQNKFHLDSEGNLSVNSITTVVDNPTTSTTVDFNSIYPIGSIYMNTALVDPVTLFGGTWELLKNRFLIGAGDLYEVGEMKGEIEHKLTKEEMPKHTHTQNPHSHTQHPDTWMNVNNTWVPKSGYYFADSGNGISNKYYTGNTTATNNDTGGSQPHNNMPPYLAVYMWKRVA